MSELTKEQLKGPDKFQKFSKKFVDWVTANKSLVTGAIVLFLVAGVAYAGYDFYRTRVEDRARLSLYEAQKIKQSMDEKEQRRKPKRKRRKSPPIRRRNRPKPPKRKTTSPLRLKKKSKSSKARR